jgi:hypothetical protein
MYRGITGDAFPYGLVNLLRPDAVQDSLGMGNDGLGRIEPYLHRLELRNGSTLFPARYISGLVAFIDTTPRLSTRGSVQHFAETERAQERIVTTETEFEIMIRTNSADFPGRHLISANAIAQLLGYSRRTVTEDWAIRQGLLLPVNVGMAPEFPALDTYFTEADFRDFYDWQRPEIPSAAGA